MPARSIGKQNANLTIAGLARAGGVGVETIRYYQRRGLLSTPERAAGSSHSGGIRRYGEADIRRLRFIRSAQAAGFTLEQIAELLELDAGKDRSRARELATERIGALDAKIAELEAARSSLQHLARICKASTGPCPILGTFERG
ncbi:MAG: MerR family transcriptional regulator [Burkholderiales bacterium]|jgi:MerR family transcriptional regulator, mercuric resistance operon regulatory protein|nr:MAG: MerR family transcriptional regulator [Burkholderiales bacterium]